MNDATFSVASAMIMAQWERAKGELRALVAIKGSHKGGGRDSEWSGYEALDEEVEAFIKRIEDEALAE